MTDKIKDKIEKQKAFCKKNEVPYFAPSDGICWSCHKQIYDMIDEDYCEREHITGCPNCCRSYCD